MSDVGLEIEDVHFAYGRGEPILRGVSTTAAAGQITAVVGNNGSGKTTLLKLLVGIHELAVGRILLDGISLDRQSLGPYKRALGFMPETLLLYPDMRADAALAFLARLKGVDVARVGDALDLVGLGAHGSKKVRTFSKGMKQRLNFAQAILGEPRVLILDEPSNGFDSHGVILFYRVLRELADAGVVIVLASHLLGEIQSQADRIAVLADGVIHRAGPTDQLLDGMAVRPKQVWMHFERSSDEADQSSLSQMVDEISREVSGTLRLHGDASLSGRMSGREVGRILSMAQRRGLELLAIRVEGGELADLLEADE